MVFNGVVTVHARRRTNPHLSSAIDEQGGYPVVVQSAAFLVLLTHGVFLYLTACGVVAAETLAIQGEEEVAAAIIGYGIDEAVGERHFELGLACLWLIRIDATVGTHPIVSPLVAIEYVGAFGRRRMSHHAPLSIEGEDAVVLHRTPHDAVSTIAKRGERATDVHV